MAINRQEMTDQIFRGAETPATSFVSPVVAGYRPNSCGENCEYNPTKARALYTQAGGPPSIKITYNTDGGHKAWVDAMCSQIKASLAVDCTGTGVPKIADLLNKLRQQEAVGLIRLSWTMDYPLMESYLAPLYTTDGSSNYYGYSNSAFDSLVREGLRGCYYGGGSEEVAAGRGHPGFGYAGDSAALRAERVRVFGAGFRGGDGPVREGRHLSG